MCTLWEHSSYGSWQRSTGGRASEYLLSRDVIIHDLPATVWRDPVTAVAHIEVCGDHTALDVAAVYSVACNALPAQQAAINRPVNPQVAHRHVHTAGRTADRRGPFRRERNGRSRSRCTGTTCVCDASNEFRVPRVTSQHPALPPLRTAAGSCPRCGCVTIGRYAY